MPEIDFEKEVLAKSQEIPVLVDFWAPWCGPCQFLGPVLEELAEAQKGLWELVKINVDEHSELSAKYSVRGIPDVKLFHKGKPKAFFTGALPKHQIENWLKEHLPDDRKSMFEDIKGRLNGDGTIATDEALEELESFSKGNPDLEEAKVLLAAYRVIKAPKLALAYIEQIKLGHKHFEMAQSVREIARLMEIDDENQLPVHDKLIVARNALLDNLKDTAIMHLIDAVILDKNYLDELPRKATIALFKIMGDRHQLTLKYRKKFDMALY